ncbi:hypothetical protein O181_012646 [Austropuccinia psidii MF-1]|uniref:Uncharacterized protein n=1 Tax=Austropuccinia psidii MF-1 TaxID=1389203 RepID=A0A9Q3GMH9_9BASI|nr:hypothetical protein [Austropuccinia psidii MF-1]
MNPTPNPRDENNHMIIPEIYESKPGFLTQSQSTDHLNILAVILQKLENLEKRDANTNLPANLETLITQLNDRTDELAEKKSNMDKVINNLLAKIDNNSKDRRPTSAIVSTPPTNTQTQTTHPLSFSAVTAGNRNTNEMALPKRPHQPYARTRFKRYHIVIRTKTALLQQNEIGKEFVDRIRWLGHPKEGDRSHGSLVIHFTNKLLAQQVLRGGRGPANPNVHHDGFQPSPPPLEPHQIPPHPHPSTRPHQAMREEGIQLSFSQTCPHFFRMTPPHLHQHAPAKHLSIHLRNLDTLRTNQPPGDNLTTTATTYSTETTAHNLTSALSTAYTSQGKWVATNPTRAKPW